MKKTLVKKKKKTAELAEDSLSRLKVAGLTILAVSPKAVKENAWNPNKMDDATFEKELLSIQNNGFIDPIKVRELPDGSFEVVDGAHRRRAALKLGLKVIPAVNLGRLPDEQAKKLTIIANELRGSPEPVLLAALLKDLNKTVDAAQLALELPMSMVEIDSLIKSTSEFSWDEIETKLDASEETSKAKLGAAPAPALNLGGERKLQLGIVRGNIPARLMDELLVEFDRSAAFIGSKNPELVMRDWLRRLQETFTTTAVPTQQSTPAKKTLAKKKAKAA